MKRKISEAFLLLLLSIFSASAVVIVPLTDLNWTLSNDTTLVPGRVPGGVYSDLMRAGILKDGDFYYRYNDLQYRWVGLTNWTYSATFNGKTELRSAARVMLVLDGVDTVAAVEVNGKIVGNTDNMFVGYFFDVTEEVKMSPTLHLSVNLVSPLHWATAAFDEQSQDYVVPPSCVPSSYRGECHANHIRKMQASFGWDWGPAFPSMGIWKPMSIVGWSTAFISDVFVDYDTKAVFPPVPDQSFQPAWLVQVKVHLRLAQPSVPVFGTVSVSLAGLVTTVHVKLGPSNDVALVVVNVTVPEKTLHLWWPSGYGEQPVYTMTTTWESFQVSEKSTKSVKIGFRQVFLDQSFIDVNNTAKGRHYRFIINGVKVFLHGSNWIPSHSLPELVTDEYTERLLRDAVLANQNSLRVWGGGVYESDHFYEVTDKLGVLVWQDFMFACSMYPSTEGFLNTVRQEVFTQVGRLNTHPSVVVWAGNNENEAALQGNWYGTVTNYKQYKSDYVSLYVNTIRDLTLTLNPSREFIVSSPSDGLYSEQQGYLAANPYSNIYGDVHYYNYLSNGWKWTTYPQPRLASEYGFQSWPSFRSMKPVTDPSDWSSSSDMMDHRQHHPLGYIQLKIQILLHMHWPVTGNNLTDFKNFLYLTQVHQAMATRTETESYRRLQSSVSSAGEGFTSGALYWQLNDIWPGASWSSIEFGGRWKLLHYYSRNFFSPVMLSPFVDGSRLKVFAVNDRTSPVRNVTLEVVLWNYKNFAPVLKEDLHISAWAPQTSAAVYDKDLYQDLLLKDRCRSWIFSPLDLCFLTFSASFYDGTRAAPDTFLLLGEPRDAPLQDANVKVSSVSGPKSDNITYVVYISSEAVALFVFLETDVDGVFSDNGFVLTEPEKSVLFTSRGRTSAAELLGNIEVTSLSDTYDTANAWKLFWLRKTARAAYTT